MTEPASGSGTVSPLRSPRGSDREASGSRAGAAVVSWVSLAVREKGPPFMHPAHRRGRSSRRCQTPWKQFPVLRSRFFLYRMG